MEVSSLFYCIRLIDTVPAIASNKTDPKPNFLDASQHSTDWQYGRSVMSGEILI